MKKTLLIGLFISLVLFCCSCSNDPHSLSSAVNPSISPDSSSDTETQQQSAPDIITPAATTGIQADAQTQLLAAPKIITPNSTTNKIGYAVNSEGILCICDGEKYGFINENGDDITPFIYDKAYPFSEGMACVYGDGKFGFINNKGITALPFIYDKASSFHEGLAYFEIGDQYGFINKNGEQVFLLNCDSVSSFNEGLAYFSINGKYGYIDETGTVVINPIYDDAGYFEYGAAKVRINDKVGVINKSGQEVVPINYDDVYTDDGFSISKLNDKYGCINGEGKIILPTKYTDVFMDHGVINFSLDEKWNIANENGEIIKTKYNNTDKVPNSDLSIVEHNDKYGLVDSTGKVIVPFKYDGIDYLDFMYYANNQEDTYAFVNRFSVKMCGKYGVIDGDGNVIKPCKYDYTQVFNNGMIVLEQNDEYSLADKDGKIISKNKYDDITQVGDFFAFKKNNKYGFLNEKGEEVVPQVYDYITLYYNDIFNSNTCFVATNYDTGCSDSIVVTKLGSKDDISSLILENEITPKIKLFHDHIQNFQIDNPFSNEETTTNVSQMDPDIKTFRLYKLDGSDNPILYVYVKPIISGNFSESDSGFFSLDNDKVNTLISGSECGGSMGGGYVCLYKDNATSKIVIATSNHIGGFGGNAYGSDFYNIMNGKASKITSYQQISQSADNYDKSNLLKTASLFYDDNNLPYTKSTILDAERVTEYDVNDKQTNISKFNKVWGRFRYIPIDISS